LEPLTDKARRLIFEFEGIDQPSDWPGGASGITIGYGYDLGYESDADFRADWSPHLSAADLVALANVVGLKGPKAEAKAASVRAIRIKVEPSKAVFLGRSVPKYQAQTRAAFPGVDMLPADVQGALFSLVYNRGAAMRDDDEMVRDRLEMRLIRDAVAARDLAEIAQQLRNMCRLWVWHEDEAEWREQIPADLPLKILRPPKHKRPMRGLQNRRIAEAELVESCIEEGGAV
jgi:GH24 family phage-related lysozyme (muramidase)